MFEFDLFVVFVILVVLGFFIGLLVGIRIGWKSAVEYINDKFPEFLEKEEK